VVKADGTGRTRLSHNAQVASGNGVLAWSPDGQSMAFTSDQEGNSEIYVMKADGTSRTRLASNVYPSPRMLASSPDGQFIAFASNQDGNGEIFVVKADGTGLTNLTNTPVDECCPVWGP